jgi:hypothetical protein
LKWDSLHTIERAIRSDLAFQEEFQLTSIHKSQLSRRINSLPIEVTQALFTAVVDSVHKTAHPRNKQNKLVLGIVDSTSLRMPPILGDWAYVTEKQNSVKVHTRLMVIDEHTAYPDQIVPSTGNVSDYIGSDYLVVDSGVLYVMDRGYVCYKRMQNWVTNQIDFVVRLANHHYAEVLKDRPTPDGDHAIVRDATVLLGNQPKTKMSVPLRLIEFYDDQNRFYRLATTKWLKQHLKFAKLENEHAEKISAHGYRTGSEWKWVFV